MKERRQHTYTKVLFCEAEVYRDIFFVYDQQELTPVSDLEKAQIWYQTLW